LRTRRKAGVMPISMSQASAPRFAHMLKNLQAILAKAQAHCEARKIDPLVLTASRLYPDMFPLSRQVQIAEKLGYMACPSGAKPKAWMIGSM